MEGTWIREPEDGTAFVFLHGVLSHGETCWRHTNGSYWPDLVANSDSLSGSGIYVFSYRTGIFSGRYRLGDVVDSLKEQMRLDGLFECETILFVAHSMGGIVARKLLVERAQDFREREIRIGLFLVASPSLGAGYANFLKPFARLLKHSQADALRFSQDNAWLLDLDKEFRNLKEQANLEIRGKELVEDVFVVFRRLVFLPQVVEPFSGTQYFGEAIKIPGSDHFSIAKPVNEEATQHRLLVHFAEELFRQPPEQPLPTDVDVSEAAESDAIRDLKREVLKFEFLDGVELNPGPISQVLSAYEDDLVADNLDGFKFSSDQFEFVDEPALQDIKGRLGEAKNTRIRRTVDGLERAIHQAIKIALDIVFIKEGQVYNTYQTCFWICRYIRLSLLSELAGARFDVSEIFAANDRDDGLALHVDGLQPFGANVFWNAKMIPIDLFNEDQSIVMRALVPEDCELGRISRLMAAPERFELYMYGTSYWNHIIPQMIIKHVLIEGPLIEDWSEMMVGPA